MIRRGALILSVSASFAYAQAAAPAPKWEAVSVKPCQGNNGGGGAPGPGRISLSCVSLDILIHQSYLLMTDGKMDLSRMQTPIEGAPAWTLSDRFSIEAKAEVSPGQTAPGRGTMLGPMLQALLGDRFKLRIRADVKQGPVYALTAVRADPGFQPAKPGSCIVIDMDNPPQAARPRQGPPMCGFPPRDASGFHGVTMLQFCRYLSQKADRTVIDKTGLAGMFDIAIDWFDGNAPVRQAPPAPGAAPPPPPPPPGPGGLDAGEQTAVLQRALRKVGLKLEATQGPRDILVVEHVEKPGEN